MVEHTVSGVGVLDKSLAVLTALEDGPLGLAELVAETGLSRATAHRLAVALEAHGLVSRDGQGRFLLGPRLIGLGRAAGEGRPLVASARPALERLRDETGESAQLYVREGSSRVCVASLESPHGLRTIVPVGAVLPLDRGSAGHVLGDHDGPKRPRLGWTESAEEREPGVASVSAPIRDGDSVIAAISVSGPIDRVTRYPGRRFGPAVVAAANAVEAATRPAMR